MQVPNLAAWLHSPETRALLAYLVRRRQQVVAQFLSGQPADPVTQGRAAALHEIAELLTQPADKVKEVLETALREHGAK